MLQTDNRGHIKSAVKWDSLIVELKTDNIGNIKSAVKWDSLIVELKTDNIGNVRSPVKLIAEANNLRKKTNLRRVVTLLIDRLVGQVVRASA